MSSSAIPAIIQRVLNCRLRCWSCLCESSSCCPCCCVSIGTLSANDLLKCRADIANDTARTHDNPAHNAKMPDNTKTYQFITGRHKTMIHDVFLLWAEYATIESGWQRIRDK